MYTGQPYDVSYLKLLPESISTVVIVEFRRENIDHVGRDIFIGFGYTIIFKSEKDTNSIDFWSLS